MAVLVAAGLAVTAGAASGGEPDDDPEVVTVTCEDGKIVVREPTDEEGKRVRVRPERAERVVVPHGDRNERGGVRWVEPVKPGDDCDEHDRPRVHRR